jgi:hypothetical protein
LLLGVDKMYRTDTLDEIRDLIYRCEPKLWTQKEEND